MDKKILFKRIAATVSAVAVFALSFLTVSSKPMDITVSADTLDEDYLLSPFANLTLVNKTPYYKSSFSFPNHIINSYNSVYSHNGNMLSDYNYQSGRVFGEYHDYLYDNGLARCLDYSIVSYLPVEFDIVGNSFFMPQRYFDLMFGTNYSNLSSPYGSFSLNYTVPAPPDAATGLFMTIFLSLKSPAGKIIEIFNGDYFYLSNVNGLYMLSEAELAGDGTKLQDFLGSFSFEQNYYYSSEDIYYYIDNFSLSFTGGYNNNFRGLQLGFDHFNFYDNYSLIDNYKVSLTSYYDVISSNSVSSDYLDEKISQSFQEGKDTGYNIGYAEGASLAQGDFDIFGTIVSAIADFLSFEILPNFTLGTLFLISFGAAFLFFVIKIFLGG